MGIEERTHFAAESYLDQKYYEESTTIIHLNSSLRNNIFTQFTLGMVR